MATKSDEMTRSERVVYTIEEFYEAHHLSRSFYFKLIKEGKGPRLMKLGRRTLISVEAAAAWRLEVENNPIVFDE